MPSVGWLLEAAAVLTGLLCVWLNVRQIIWTWPVTIVSCMLFGVLFFDARLYGTMGLQGLFVIIAVYGWRSWLTGGVGSGHLQVSSIAFKTGLILGGITVVMMTAIYFGLSGYTDAAYPLVDALTTALSISASWMQAHKFLESWLVWIITNMIYVGLYSASVLYLTCGLYVIYLVLAVAGYLAWRRSLQPFQRMTDILRDNARRPATRRYR